MIAGAVLLRRGGWVLERQTKANSNLAKGENDNNSNNKQQAPKETKLQEL